MRLCFSTLACPTWSLPQIVGAAVAHGLKGIDLRGIGSQIDITRLLIFDGELPATLELLRRHELSVPCLNTSIGLVTPAQDRWEMMLDECRRYASLAASTGTPFVRIFGGVVPRGMRHDEATTMARRHLRQLIKVCAAQGCLALLETHNQWATSEQVLELLEGFSPEEVGVLWNIEPPCRRGESPRQTTSALRRYIRHIHFKDSVHHKGKSLPRLLGHGDLPLGEALQAMDDIGYKGWICLETEKRWHPEEAPEPEQSLPQFVEYMKGTMKAEC